MRIVRISKQLASIEEIKPSVATIGFFDGVHKGHAFLLDKLKKEASRRGLTSTVITFDRHPRQVLGADFQPAMLSTLEEKLSLLKYAGVDTTAIVNFSEVVGETAYEFMRDTLVSKLAIKVLLTGYDNRFGHNRREGFDDYKHYGEQIGIEVLHAEPYVLDGVNISSSVVRSFLVEGEVELARECLGYPYTLIGRVAEGEHIGTDIGFPTANLEVEDREKLVPAGGVYAVKMFIADEDESSWADVRKEKLMEAMMNIGMRPTFGGKDKTLETHIFNFHGDLYGKRIGVAFFNRLRTERKFRSPAELAAQLRRDAVAAQKVLKAQGDIK